MVGSIYLKLKALNIEQLKNKKITRATLIREFKEEQADKSAFSYWLDPIIYSSKVSLQMFATMLKDKMYQANDDTQADIYKISELYKEYEKSVGGSLNPNTFNDALLEVQEYRVYNPTTGKREPMNILCLDRKSTRLNSSHSSVSRMPSSA